MMLSDVWEYTKGLKLSEHTYMGKMDAKMEKSIGVYNSKHSHGHKTAIGGPELESYGTKYVTFLIHWNKSPSDTEKAAVALFNALREVSNEVTNRTQIQFIQMLTSEPVDVGADDSGIHEMVIEAAVVYRKGDGNGK